MSELVRIVTRKSPLAMWQTQHVAKLLEDAFGVTTQVVTVDTTGDRIVDKPLPSIGGKGLFTAELEDALLRGEAELAVHSLKDLQSSLPDGLVYGGSPTRAPATDCLVSPRWGSVDELPEDAVLATGSVRRRAQLLAYSPGLQFRELRGNIETRLRKLHDNGWDAIVMATAALHRLDRRDLIAAELPSDRFVPAVSQGAIGIELREDRTEIAAMVQAISDPDTVTAVRGERRFMARLEGGCSVPVAAYCWRDGGAPEGTRAKTKGEWAFAGWVGSLDGAEVLHEVARGDDPLVLADAMATSFIERGAARILGR